MLKEKVVNIINDSCYEERCTNIEEENMRIRPIATDVRISKHEIQDLSEQNKDVYH